MAVTFDWDIKLYDLSGNLLQTLTQASNRHLTYALNGLDTFECDLFLDDAAAVDVHALTTTIKVSRSISDTDFGKTLTPTAGTPDFAGVVTAVTKQGQANMMHVMAQCPLWRLQSRFHILNHHLVKDYTGSTGNEDGEDWDQSALMWKLISLVNGAFGGSSFTGIVKPTGSAPFWPKTIAVAPYRVPKGSNTWQLIFDDLMNRPGAADIAPQYIHTAASPNLMYFKTAIKRGTDRHASVNLDYCTGNKNLTDFVEDVQVVPGSFANYVWAIGQGGPNTSVALAEDITGTYGRNNIGIYMSQADDTLVGQVKDLTALGTIATSVLNKQKVLPVAYNIAVGGLIPPYFGIDFFLGDVVSINADKGALSVSGVKQRIYQVDLSMTDNCNEICSVLLANDFQGKVATTP